MYVGAIKVILTRFLQLINNFLILQDNKIDSAHYIQLLITFVCVSNRKQHQTQYKPISHTVIIIRLEDFT